ncbi:MAG TPA: preprotein translocase subunit SecE [Oligoflexia bacterium]|nr:preprotein translocase subunit SecE [Oligoflexia bacterium]HMP26392.1 preprotein translocase subunit SecE [Oligoflexia bacterium]
MNEQRGGIIAGILGLPDYIRESVAELKKVAFPTKRETVQAALATFVIIAFFSICIFLFDLICQWLITLLIG